MWMLLALAVASAAPMYNADDITLRTKKQSTKDLRALLATELRESNVALTWVDGDTRSKVGPKKETTLADLERPALMAVLLGLQPTIDPGMEYDLLFKDDEGEMKPVTVWIGAKRKALEVAQGDTLPAPVDGPAGQELVKKYRLAGIKEFDAVFEPKVRGAIDQALSMLSPEERALLSDITLVRQGGDTRSVQLEHPPKWINTATYVLEENVGRIEVYDEAVLSTSRFVGSVDAPIHPTVFILLHELGHAIADAPFRKMLQEYEARRVRFNTALSKFEAKRKAYNQLVDLHNQKPNAEASKRLDKAMATLKTAEITLKAENASVAALGDQIDAVSDLTPMGRRFQELVGKASPTEYGKSSPDEALADAFALFHADPAALKRTMPTAYDWFASGAHLEGEKNLETHDGADDTGASYVTGVSFDEETAPSPVLRKVLTKVLTENGLTVVHADGTALDLDAAERPALLALQTAYLVSRKGNAPFELDLMVSGPDGGTVPATIWREDATFRLAVGAPIPTESDTQSDTQSDTPTWESLTTRFGVAPSDDSAPFEPALLSGIEASLALLSDTERERLRNLRFTRISEAPTDRHGLQAAASYGPADDAIFVHDLALEPGRTFVGDIDTPHPTLVRVLLHEMCHAIGSATWRAREPELQSRYEGLKRVITEHTNALTDLGMREEAGERIPKREWKKAHARSDWIAMERDRLTVLKAEIDGLLTRPPLARAYRKLGAAPTTIYARLSDPEEQACEAFSLYRADPDALLRIAPAAHAWFAAGHHLTVSAGSPE